MRRFAGRAVTVAVGVALMIASPGRAALSLYDPSVSIEIKELPLNLAVKVLSAWSGVRVTTPTNEAEAAAKAAAAAAAEAGAPAPAPGPKPVDLPNPKVTLTVQDKPLSAVVGVLAKSAQGTATWRAVTCSWLITPGSATDDARPGSPAGQYTVKLDRLRTARLVSDAFVRNELPSWTERMDVELSVEAGTPVGAMALLGIDADSLKVTVNGQPTPVRRRFQGAPATTAVKPPQPPYSAAGAGSGIFDFLCDPPPAPPTTVSVEGTLLVYPTCAERAFTFDELDTSDVELKDGGVSATLQKFHTGIDGVTTAQFVVSRKLGSATQEGFKGILRGTKGGVVRLDPAGEQVGPATTTFGEGRGGAPAAWLGDRPLGLDGLAAARWFGAVLTMRMADGKLVPVDLRDVERNVRFDGTTLTISMRAVLGQLANKPNALLLAVMDAGDKCDPVPFKLADVAVPAPAPSKAK
jgi:hypothetical protein